jgi:alpha-tubulin suppressor-like RCC1 family protein
MATTIVTGVQYSGIWTLQQAHDALAAGTWTGITSTRLFTFGGNNYGQLGLGTQGTNISSPNQVGTLTTWTKIAGGGDNTHAIKTDGTLWAWGSNSFGSLGLGNTTQYSSPKQVGALTTWLSVAGAYRHTLAVKTDGTLWSWGLNNNGALGLGGVNTGNYSSPRQVGGATTWSKVAAGGYHSAAITTDGTLYAWGGNGFGQVGNGTQGTNILSPVQIGALTDWASVACGFTFTLGVRTNGAMYAWGLGNSGQLGLGNVTYYSSPKQVGALTTWSKISGGNYSAAAIKTDGTLWTWGAGADGQLGDGTSVSKSSPVQVGALTDWSEVTNGYYHCLAVRSKTLWGWGVNSSGQLGIGDNTKRSSPTQVGSLATWLNVSAGLYQSIAITSTTTGVP